MTVITKKDEKIQATVEALDQGFSQEQFIEKFKELFPKDWFRIEKNYQDHERKTKPGKSHPMPSQTSTLETR